MSKGCSLPARPHTRSAVSHTLRFFSSTTVSGSSTFAIGSLALPTIMREPFLQRLFSAIVHNIKWHDCLPVASCCYPIFSLCRANNGFFTIFTLQTFLDHILLYELPPHSFVIGKSPCRLGAAIAIETLQFVGWRYLYERSKGSLKKCGKNMLVDIDFAFLYAK